MLNTGLVLKLRPPQQELLEAAHAAYKRGLHRLLIQLPTGVGKTPTFASVRSFFGFKKKVLVLIHMEELAMQAAQKLKVWNPGLDVSIEMADRTHDDRHDFVVASVPTLCRPGNMRLARFDPTEYDAVICDEAHHSISPSWKRVLEHFGFSEAAAASTARC